jgi:hypothetical protein
MTLMSAWLPAPDLRPPFDYFSQVANRSGHDTPSFTVRLIQHKGRAAYLYPFDSCYNFNYMSVYWRLIVC